MFRAAAKVLKQVELFVSAIPAEAKIDNFRAVLPKDSKITLVKSYGFFSVNEEDVPAALESLRSMSFGEKKLFVKINYKRRVEERKANVFDQNKKGNFFSGQTKEENKRKDFENLNNEDTGKIEIQENDELILSEEHRNAMSKNIKAAESSGNEKNPLDDYFKYKELFVIRKDLGAERLTEKKY